MSQHRFKLGQRLFPPHSVDLDVSDQAYVVVKRLPARDGEFEYQIKSLDEPHQRRVVRESQLKPNPSRFRRESHHSDGITDQISLQRTSATKSAQSGHYRRTERCPLFGE
jgi:hypothetical protein